MSAEAKREVGELLADELPNLEGPSEVRALEIERDALIAKLNGAAEKVREFAETWLFDAERDCPMVAYAPAFDLADTIAAEATS